MAVGKISANLVSNMGFGVSAENKTPEISHVTEPKRDSKKVLMWALGGLAVAGAAGVLIYNARKGKSVGGSSASGAAAAAGGSFSLGAFAKKFADEAIFAKTIENVQNNVAGVRFSNAQKGCWEMCNDTELFGCRLLKPEQPEANGFVSCFDFASPGIEFQVLNHKDGKTIFNLGEVFAFNVDSANGKVVDVFSSLGGISNDRLQKFVDDLDLAKLINDSEYRSNYCKSIRSAIEEVVERENFSLLAEKTGKTFDEVKVIHDSSEFQDYSKEMIQLQDDINSVNYGLDRFIELFNVPESLNIEKIFGFVEGKHEIHFLEDFLAGNKTFKYSANKIEDGSGLIPRQTVAEICDLSVHNEKIKLGDGTNGNFIAYEKYNEDMTDFVNIRYYKPTETGKPRVTQITTKELSLDMEDTADGIQRLVVRRGGEEISDAEKDTLMTVLRDESIRVTFVKDFVTRGKEMLENYLK